MFLKLLDKQSKKFSFIPLSPFFFFFLFSPLCLTFKIGGYINNLFHFQFPGEEEKKSSFFYGFIKLKNFIFFIFYSYYILLINK